MKSFIETGPFGLRVIGALKLLSGVFGLALAFGLLKLLKHDMATSLEHVVEYVRLDPDRRIIRSAIAWVSGIPRHDLRLVEVATFFYAGLHCTEGLGLLFKRTWASYLTVLATTALVPLELYALTKHVSVAKILALAINLLIVAYLVDQLRRHLRQHREQGRPESPLQGTPA